MHGMDAGVTLARAMRKLYGTPEKVTLTILNDNLGTVQALNSPYPRPTETSLSDVIEVQQDKMRHLPWYQAHDDIHGRFGVAVKHIDTSANIADPLTKAMPVDNLRALLMSTGRLAAAFVPDEDGAAAYQEPASAALAAELGPRGPQVEPGCGGPEPTASAFLQPEAVPFAPRRSDRLAAKPRVNYKDQL
jgi:hypothetical protein